MTGRKIIHFPATASTNDDLKAMVASADGPVYAVVSAAAQTGGRGRLGRSFFSPPGGLYVSVSFPLTGKETNVPCLTLIAGLCMCEALEDLCRIAPQIKWPNDLFLNDKKLCGILCELVSGKTPTAIVGAGVNLTVKKDDVPPDLREKMTSLAAEGVAPPSPEELIAAFAEKLDRAVYEDRVLSDDAAAGHYFDRIRERSYLTGKTVRCAVDGVPLTGIFTGVSPTGTALLRLPDGSEKQIVSGEIVF